MSKYNSFHKSNFGAFGGNLPTDLDGYVHRTQAAWLAAPMDEIAGKMTRAEASQKASDARHAVKEAEAGLAEWNANNA